MGATVRGCDITHRDLGCDTWCHPTDHCHVNHRDVRGSNATPIKASGNVVAECRVK
jgi:hypothetical protein